jgi:hypothetical protein
MPQAELEPERLRAAGQEYVEMVSRLAPGFERVVDKAPLNFLHAGLIHLMIPGARIIHCRRDALDTCFSCYLTLFDRHLGFSYDLRELGRFYRSYVRLMEHWRAVLPAERFIEVRYEDVVGDLESQAQRLVAFCGLEWDPRCLAFHKTARPVSTASMNQVRKPLYATSIGRAQSVRPYLVPLAQALDTL